MDVPVALRRGIRRDLVSSHTSRLADIKAFIASKNYYMTENSGQVLVSPLDRNDVRAAVSGDCSRFARAVLETLNGIVTEQTNARYHAWMVVRAYYAAFYSAHLFLRLFGRSCTHFNGQEFSILKQVASLQGINLSGKGFFLVTFTEDSNLALTGLNNSHEDTWASLLTLLDDIRAGVPRINAPKISRDETITFLSDLIEGITKNNSFQKGNWLSHVRNQVQYRFDYKVWFPYGHNYPDNVVERKAKSAVRGDFIPMEKHNDLAEFYSLAMQFSSLCLSMIDLIVDDQAECSAFLKSEYRRLREQCRTVEGA